jgi:hypothetical protein
MRPPTTTTLYVCSAQSPSSSDHACFCFTQDGNDITSFDSCTGDQVTFVGCDLKNYSMDCGGTIPEYPTCAPTPSPPTPPPTPVMYSCNSTVGKCQLDPTGSLSPGDCIATCTVVPTPAPVMYSCNSTTGQCNFDPRGSLSPGECIAACKCIVPNNCGQLNNTAHCGAVLTGCNVCDSCCSPWITEQAACDGCFTAPAPSGCGGE